MVIDEEAISEAARMIDAWMSQHRDEPFDAFRFAAATAAIGAQVVAARNAQ